MMELKEITAQSLERIRRKRGLTHKDFAEALGLNRTSLYLYESGRRVVPTELLCRIWEQFKVDPNDVLGIVKD